MNKKFNRIVLFLFVSALLIVNLGPIANAVFSVSQTMSSNGSITAINVSVFSDAACMVNATSVNWGIVDPGGSVNRTVYVKNTGNTAEVLSFATNNWFPVAASNYASVNWNLQGYVLVPGQVATANLCLTVSSSIVNITDFSGNLVISGTQ
jgi:archaellum component FlaG (FlaF/FlaG flagellin family)